MMHENDYCYLEDRCYRDEQFDKYYHKPFQSDWKCTNPASPEYIRHKPDLSILHDISYDDIKRWNGINANIKDLLFNLQKLETFAVKQEVLNDQLKQQIEDIQAEAKDSHNHPNLDILNRITEALIQNSHSHLNKTSLDEIKPSNLNAWNQTANYFELKDGVLTSNYIIKVDDSEEGVYFYD